MLLCKVGNVCCKFGKAGSNGATFKSKPPGKTSFMNDTNLFGTDGIRGIANQWPITPEVALKVGRALATLLPVRPGHTPKVVVGKDTRLSGYMLETALAAGLVSAGVDVLFTGPVPTPGVAYLTKSMRCDAGVMITASHNPFDHNGLKILGADGYKLSDEDEERIAAYVLDAASPVQASPRGVGKARRVDDAVGRYIEFVKGSLGGGTLEGLRVVVDAGNGAGYAVAPQVLEELGAEVIRVGTSPDGYNINDHCGAMHPERAAKAVLEHKAHAGICLDGDADRIVMIDSDGRVVSGDRVLYLCAKTLKDAGRLAKSTAVATVMSNLGLRDALEARGIALEITGVGDRLVLDRMREKGYCFGGENSGHIIFSDYATTGDGIVSALHMLAAIAATGQSLHALTAEMREYAQEVVSMPVREKKPLAELPEVLRAIANAEAVMGAKGRTLVRYSGTERKLRVLVECPELVDARRHVADIVAAAQPLVGV